MILLAALLIAAFFNASLGVSVSITFSIDAFIVNCSLIDNVMYF